MIRPCPHCAAKNRIPVEKLSHQGRCGRCKAAMPALSTPLEVDQAAFDDIISHSEVPVLVDFWAPWCGPCKQAAPELAKAASRLAGEGVVIKINTEEQGALAARYGVRSIPFFAVFRGGAIAVQQAGLIPAERMVAMVAG